VRLRRGWDCLGGGLDGTWQKGIWSVFAFCGMYVVSLSSDDNRDITQG
jgi:hypothetical protein